MAAPIRASSSSTRNPAKVAVASSKLKVPVVVSTDQVPLTSAEDDVDGAAVVVAAVDSAPPATVVAVRALTVLSRSTSAGSAPPKK